MSNFRARCDEHGYCGPCREKEEDAEKDRADHRRNVPGPHGAIRIVPC
jgi:hypothetical protein